MLKALCVILSVLLLSTCKDNVALGGAIDINPPSVTITSPGINSKIRNSFTLKGEAKDDKGISAVTVLMEHRDFKVSSGMVNAEINGASGKWSAVFNRKDKEGKYPLPDGIYSVTVLVKDISGKTAETKTVLEIDNTPPILVLNRPGTLGSALGNSVDTFGQEIWLDGESADISGIAKLDATAYSTADAGEIAKISVPNITPTVKVKLDVYNGTNNFYNKLYTGSDTGRKELYLGIELWDNTQEYDSPDTNGKPEEGNYNNVYYLYAPLYNKIVFPNYTVNDLYKMMNGLWKTDERLRSISEKVKTVVDGLKSGSFENTEDFTAEKPSGVLTDAGKKKIGLFGLNPAINPLYEIIGFSPKPTADEGNYDEYKQSPDSGITVKVSSNIDGTPLTAKENFKYYLFEYSKYIASADDFAQAYELPPVNTDVQGKAYLVSLKIPKEAVQAGKRYILKVKGADKDGNAVMPNQQGNVSSNPLEYGFRVEGVGRPPEVPIKAINGEGQNGHLTPASSTWGTEPEITKIIYVKGGENVKCEGHLACESFPLTVDYTLANNNLIVFTGRVTKNESESRTVDFEIPASNFSGGSGYYTIRVVATDQKALKSDRSYTVYYDGEAPVLTVTTRGEDSLKGEISDGAGAGVKKLEIMNATFNGTTTGALSLGFPEGGTSPWQVNGLTANGDGLYQFTFAFEDKVGNRDNKRETFRYDSASPVIQNCEVNGSSEPDKSFKEQSVTIKGAIVEAGGKPEVKVDGITIGENDITGNGTDTDPYIFTKTKDFTDGQHIVKVKVTDKAGKTAEKELSFRIDTTPPAVAFANGFDNKTVNKKVKISGTANDEKGLKEVELKIKTGNKKDGTDAAGTSLKIFNNTEVYTWSYELNTEDYKDNADLQLEATATDLAGNPKTDEITVKVNQNNDRPQVVITNIENLDNFFLTMDRILYGSVSDDDGEIETFEVSEDGSNYTAPTSISAGQWSYKFKGDTDGDKKLYFKIKDKAETTFTSNESDLTADSAALLTVPKIFAKTLPGTEPVLVQGKVVKLKIDNNPPQFGSPDVQVTTDSNFASGLINLDGLNKFAREKIFLQVKVKDENGIQSVTVKNLGVDRVLAKHSGSNGSDEIWRSGEIDLNSVPEGTVDVIIEIKDNAGSPAKVNRAVIIDRTFPVAKLTYPASTDVVGGEVQILGTIKDEGAGVSGVKTDGTKYKFVKRSAAVPQATDTGWKDMNASTIANWSAKYNFDTISQNPSEYGTQHGSTSYYDIPMYIRVEDEVGNAAVIQQMITLNPNGKKPVVKVLSPSADTRLGGTIRIFGTASVLIGSPTDVGEVDIMFSKTGNFNMGDCTFGTTNWYNTGNGCPVAGTDVTGGAQWTCTINEDGSFNPASGTTQNVWFKVRAKNKTIADATAAFGEWSESIKIVIDTEAPTIGSPEALKIDATTASMPSAVALDYIANMWIGENQKLFGSLYDKSGIKEIKISGGLNGGTPMDKAFLLSKNWIVADTGHTSETAEPNYTLALPLDLATLSATAQVSGEFTVKIEITENTSDKMRSEQTLTFRFDTTKPSGDFGEKLLVSSGLFAGSEINNQTLADKITGIPGQYKIFVDNKVHSVTACAGSKVTFDGDPVNGEKFFILYKPETLIFDGTGEWQVMGIASDGGSGVKEVEAWVTVGSDSTDHTKMTEIDPTNKITKELGTLVSWKGSIKTNGKVSDGKGKLHYKITDYSNNEYTQEVDVQVRNKPLKVTKVILGTKVGGADLVAPKPGIPADGDANLKITANATDVDLNHSIAYTSENFAFKSKDSSYIQLEFNGGEGTMQYKLKHNNTELHSLGAIPTGGKIMLTDSDLTTINNSNGTPTTIEVLIWDSPNGFTQGNGTPAATVKITTLFDALDEQAPTTVILPFFWNDENQNSLKGNSRNNGHIEIKESGNSQVSGKVVLRGFAYDNTNIKMLTATVAAKSVSLTTIKKDETKTENGLTLTVTKIDTDYMGHYVEWQLEWDTEILSASSPLYPVGTGKQITVIAYDGVKSNNAADASWTMTNVTQNGFTVQYSASIPAGTERNQFVLLKQGEKQYLGRVESVNETAKTVTLKNDVALAGLVFDKALVFGYTNNASKIAVDIVPYVRRLKTGLSTSNENTSYEKDRTVLGKYPVRIGEVLAVEGFNLTGAVLSVNGETLTSNKVVSNAKSGKLTVAVNGVEAGNNSSNNNKVWNQIPSKKYKNAFNDDLELDVWEFNSQAAVPTRGKIRQPVMRIHPKDGNGLLGFAFTNGPDYFNMPNGQVNSWQQWHKNYDEFGSVAFVFDENGVAHAVTVGQDTNSGQNHAGKFTYLNSKWGKGNLTDQDNYGGVNAIRLEHLGQNNGTAGTDINKERIVSPSIAVAGTQVYLAYYDAINSQLRFRTGQYPDSKSNFGQFKDAATTSAVGVYSGSDWSLIAGSTVAVTDPDFGKPEKIANGKPGEFAAIAVVKKTAPASDDIIVAVWQNAAGELVYSYNKTPSTAPADTPKTGAQWQAPVVIFTNASDFCQIAVDAKDGIHIAAYDGGKGGVQYAYMTGYDQIANIRKCAVDGGGVFGADLTMDIVMSDDADSIPIPYFGYQGSGLPRTAYLVGGITSDIKNGTKPFDGYDSSGLFTGMWEIGYVPTENRLHNKENRINIAIWKDGNGKVKSTTTPGTTTSPVHNGTGNKVYVNGTKNPILGYSLYKGAIETAQKK